MLVTVLTCARYACGDLTIGAIGLRGLRRGRSSSWCRGSAAGQFQLVAGPRSA